MNKYASRKFILALIFALTGCVAFLFFDKGTFGEFVSLALGITGLFTAGDVAIKKFVGKDAE